MKKFIYITSILLLVSISIVIALYHFSYKINYSDNGFIRLFPPHPVLPENNFDLKYNSYFIAGATTNDIYLGNYAAPLHLLRINTLLTDTQHLKLSIRDLKKIGLKKIHLTVDSPYFYLMDGIRPAILRGTIGNWEASRYMYDSAYFTEAIPISSSSFAIRTVNSKSENILGKEKNTYPHVNLKHDLLVKQVDGLFCTDGMLHYDKRKNMLTFLYYYRNQYICMDTNFHILFKGKTIDTISRAQIKVASIKSENSITMAAPPLIVNKRSCVSGKYLFVNSNLLARNENKEAFDKASVIDVYDLEGKTYKFSFYLYDVGDIKLKSFRVYGNILIALYDNYIFTYKLVPKYFP